MLLKILFSCMLVTTTFNQTFGGAEKILRFTLAARDLPKYDAFGGRPDPFLKIKFDDGKGGGFISIGETETVDDTTDPYWKNVYQLEYAPKRNQLLNFEVWDRDVSSHDIIGSVELKLADIANGGTIIEKKIPPGCKGGSNCGYLRIIQTVFA